MLVRANATTLGSGTLTTVNSVKSAPLPTPPVGESTSSATASDELSPSVPAASIKLSSRVEGERGWKFLTSRRRLPKLGSYKNGCWSRIRRLYSPPGKRRNEPEYTTVSSTP